MIEAVVAPAAQGNSSCSENDVITTNVSCVQPLELHMATSEL